NDIDSMPCGFFKGADKAEDLALYIGAVPGNHIEGLRRIDRLLCQGVANQYQQATRQGAVNNFAPCNQGGYGCDHSKNLILISPLSRLPVVTDIDIEPAFPAVVTAPCQGSTTKINHVF